MEILNYFLIAVVAAIGLILGRILAWTAKEEIKPGTKYLLILQKALFCLAIALLMYFNRTNVHYVWIGALVIFIYLSWFKKIPSYAFSVILGILFYLASLTEKFVLISAVIFLHGLPAGSLMKNKKMLALNVLVFLINAMLLFLIGK